MQIQIHAVNLQRKSVLLKGDYITLAIRPERIRNTAESNGTALLLTLT